MPATRIEPGELPDERAYRRSASQIGWQVMAVCAGLVVIGGGVILAFVFWQTTPWEANQPPQPGEIEVRLDPGELVLAVVLLATGAVLSAGFAARMIARRAVEPLDEAFQLQRRFVADASHELRTPLAVLGARAPSTASGVRSSWLASATKRRCNWNASSSGSTALRAIMRAAKPALSTAPVASSTTASTSSPGSRRTSISPGCGG
ncbi:hypothetical protein BMH30_14740 [Leucobacter sp. OLES1]|nr:hypothetical protein BMH30_14740 [Leucobacter sp. OLES1]